MAPTPRCSECAAPLVFAEGHPRAGAQKPPGTKTCSDGCRQKRARRLKRAGKVKSSKHAPEVQDIAAVARGELKDVAHEVLKEELRPIVREAMTADVLNGIGLLVKLQSTAIEKLEEDLGSADETIRQRAYTLLLKYTMGNPSVAPPPAEQAPAAMNVVFNIPRPGDAVAELPVDPPPELPGDAVEMRDCSDCHETKPASEFVAGSPKCQECFDGLQDKLRERFK